ncbi:MAG: response regulator, partial [Rhodospirillaceae bacterium]|nr:response regulator [Rhodospirillaceae bacterium]
MRILVVEDDLAVAKQVADILSQAKYVVDLAHDGEEAHFLGDTEPYDAVILDLGIPLMDGLSVLEKWRLAGKTMPVLILSARNTWREKVAGLRTGADDYLAKPFEMEELLA